METGSSARGREYGDGLDPGNVPRPPAKPPVNPRRRRDKPQLSCDACRRRRLKCDRNQPCENCSKRMRRGIQQQCTYPGDRGKGPGAPSIRHKIEDLERQVRALAARANRNDLRRSRGPTPEHPVEGSTLYSKTVNQKLEENRNDPGALDRNPSETLLDDEPQLSAILDNISHIKDHVLSQSGSYEPLHSVNCLSGLSRVCFEFGTNRCETEEDILSMLPPREVADDLVNKYFGVLTLQIVAQVMLHRPTFLQDYEKFWKHPRDLPITWVGFLFSIFSIGACYSKQTNSQTNAVSVDRPLVQRYREAAVQCLAIGRYKRVTDYLVETLLHLIHIQYLQHEDSEMELWVMLGVAIRLAQKMGYHRDPSHFLDLTTFQAEMRRRVWILISDLDTSVSAMFGLPKMINPIHCDTREPQHLRDEDIRQDMTELPPSRPETEETPIVYLVGRHRIFSLAARVSEFLSLGCGGRQEEAFLLDERIQHAYQRLPDAIKLHSDRTFYDSPDGSKRLLRAMMLALVYYKTRCVLHRPYLSTEKDNAIFAVSRKHCLESALQLIQCQIMLYQETQPGGRLDKPWKMSSVMIHDFLLGTTVVASDIDQGRRLDMANRDSLSQLGIDALAEVYPIWLEWRAASVGARKAVDMLRVVLEKAHEPLRDGLQSRATHEAAKDDSDELVDALLSLSADKNVPPVSQQNPTQVPEQFFMFGFDDLVHLLEGTAVSTRL